MGEKPYTLAPDEKATQVMVGTSDALLWGALVTKELVRLSVYLNTLAEDFVPLYNVKILFLAPAQQVAPVERALVCVKLEEILVFFSMADLEPLPEEMEMRRFEPLEAIVGSYQIEGMILKSPITPLQSMMLVATATYMPMYKVTIRHVAKPWLGTFSSNIVQVRRDRLLAMTRE
jgi:hypothetical protein